MKRTFAFIIMFALLLSSFAFAESFTGKVISVIDGNNLILASGTQTYRVRLAGAECPEIDQPFGSQAKQFVTDFARGRDVWVNVKGTDHDNRIVSTVVVDGRDLSLEVVNAGLAWSDTKFQSSSQIAAAEKYVKENKIGMWAFTGNKKPMVYRMEKRGIAAVMSKTPCRMGKHDFSSSVRKKFGWGVKDASWPSKGWRNPCGNAPISNAPGTSSIRSSAPGCAPPFSTGPAGNPFR